jgi:hypothetical protein
MRNRVTPMGDIVAIELRGAWLGNRGIVHRGTEIVRYHASNLWIVCALEYQGRRTPQWKEGRYTALFFHDEAVALAAGHRPCAFCRRQAYELYRQSWAAGLGSPVPSAKQMNEQLHAERLVRGTHRPSLHPTEWAALPSGAFVVLDGVPALVLEHVVVPWSYEGYGPASPRPRAGVAEAITPPSSLAAIANGYAPQIDASATAQDRSAPVV